jgi:D-alanine--poly(phosphoribitol) ligase subunit 2
MKKKIIDIILHEVSELNEQLDHKVAIENGENAGLYGLTGVLDSLGLVTLIVAIEQAIEDELGLVISLADERAMSQKNSPFRTIGTLADYIVKVSQEEA